EGPAGEQPPPDTAPSVTSDAGTDSGTDTPDGGSVIVEPPPDSGSEPDDGTEPFPDAGTPDGGGGTPPGRDGGTPGRDDAGTDAGTPDGGTKPEPDAGTEPEPDAGTHEPPISGGPATRSQQWRASYYAGVAPGGLAVADFNGDGAQDVAVNAMGDAHQSQYRARLGNVFLLLNDGEGRLQTSTSRHLLSSSSGLIAAGDADRDGKMDVVVGTMRLATLLRGQGDGTFVEAYPSFAQGAISSLGFWPGEGDSAPRVWAAGNSSVAYDMPRAQAGIEYLSVTNGEFMSHRFLRPDGLPVVYWGDSRVSATAADFNEDGQMDVAVASDDQPLTRYLATSTGFYSGETVAPVYANSVETADMDGDGHADLVVENSQALWVYRGRGYGGFHEPIRTPIPYAASRLRVSDVNVDGKPDVVLLHPAERLVSLWQGNQAGGFSPPYLLTTGRSPRDVAVADLDRDGSPELLVAEAGDNTVSVYDIPRAPLLEQPALDRCPMVLHDRLSNADAPTPRISVDTGVAPRSMAVGDFDGDGRQDFAVLTRDPSVRLLLQSRPGNFEKRDVLQESEVQDLAAGDFDGDGKADLATIGWQGLQLHWSDGLGAFPTRTDLPGYSSGGGYVVAEDFNRDGRLDVGATLTTQCSPYGALFMNQGEGVLARVDLSDQNYEPGVHCAINSRPTVGDFNGDGTLDFMYATLGLNLYYVMKDGTVTGLDGFANGTPFPTRSAADVDGDGALDVLLMGPHGELLVRRGDGGGTLQRPLTCPSKALSVSSVEALDVNGDGHTDLLGRDATGMLVALGKGQGRYARVQRYPLEAWPLWVRPMKLLGDAPAELVVLLESGKLLVFPTPTFPEGE
ncbi:FG-GAP-like repeat-containing protein, partial [Pyxidicoccus fallax]|uniref:FG-GAP-like repeat-containing protein n=1 Tax=Pyxidicoccus fallax TaxID=394095 RepID=UPI001C12F127